MTIFLRPGKGKPNRHHTRMALSSLPLLAYAGLALFSSLPLAGAESPAAPSRSLVLPVTISPAASAPASPVPAKPASLDCVVSCGTPLPLSAVAFSPDGKTLAVGGYREVLLWDLVEAKLTKRLGAGQIGAMVQAVVFTKDGRSLAVAEGVSYQSGVVRVFDLSSDKQTAEFKEPKGLVLCLALSGDGKLLVGGSQDAAAYVWNLEEKKLVATLKDHTLPVLCVSFGQDDKFLATGSADRTVQVWEVATWKPDLKKTKREGEVRRCKISNSRTNENKATQHNLTLIVGGREDRTLQINVDSKAPAWAKNEVKAEMDAGMPLDCTWPPKGSNKFYVACSDHTVKLFTQTGLKLDFTAALRGHDDWVYAVALSPDGTRLASASGDGTVKLWNTTDNNLLATLIQIAPGADDWLIVTPRGYLTGSKADRVEWKASAFKLTPEKIASLQNPDMVRQVLAGRQTPAPSLP